MVAPPKHGYPARQDAIGQLFFLLFFPLIILRENAHQLLGHLFGDDLGGLDVLEARGLQVLERLEVLHQRLLSHGPQTRHVVQNTRRHTLAAQLAVEGDGEAVGLVAHLLHQVQRRRA